MKNYIKIYGLNEINIKINNSVLTKVEFINLINNVLNNIYCSYDSAANVNKIYIRDRLNRLKNTNNKNEIYYQTREIINTLECFNLEFK